MICYENVVDVAPLLQQITITKKLAKVKGCATEERITGVILADLCLASIRI